MAGNLYKVLLVIYSVIPQIDLGVMHRKLLQSNKSQVNSAHIKHYKTDYWYPVKNNKNNVATT